MASAPPVPVSGHLLRRAVQNQSVIEAFPQLKGLQTNLSPDPSRKRCGKCGGKTVTAGALEDFKSFIQGLPHTSRQKLKTLLGMSINQSFVYMQRQPDGSFKRVEI